MAKKTVSDTLQETLAQVVREAIGNIGGEEPQKAKKGVLGGGKGLFAGAGLAAAAPLLKKAVDALRDGSLDEMIAFVVAVFGVLIAAAFVDESDAGGLGAKQAWLYVTILTVGYMVSRGLAKSGSRDETR